MAQLIEGESENRPINRRHPLKPPAAGSARDLSIQIGEMLPSPLGQIARSTTEFRRFRSLGIDGIGGVERLEGGDPRFDAGHETLVM